MKLDQRVTYTVDKETVDKITGLCSVLSVKEKRFISRSELIRIAIAEKFERDWEKESEKFASYFK